MRCRPDLSRSTGWRNRPAALSVVLVARGYVADGSLTDAGDDALARLREALRERLAERLNGWSPERHEELGELLAQLARDLPPDRAAAVEAGGPGRPREPVTVGPPGRPGPEVADGWLDPLHHPEPQEGHRRLGRRIPARWSGSVLAR